MSLLPNPGDPDLLARIELTGRMVPAERDHALFSGIRDRRTNRHPFSPDPIPEAALARARAQAERQQTWLQTSLRRQIATLWPS